MRKAPAFQPGDIGERPNLFSHANISINVVGASHHNGLGDVSQALFAVAVWNQNLRLFRAGSMSIIIKIKAQYYYWAFVVSLKFYFNHLNLKLWLPNFERS